MPLVSRGAATRWAPGCGPLGSPSGAELPEADAADLMPKLGLYLVDVGGEAFPVERVGSRYCSLQDVVEYGRRNGDDFSDASRLTDDDIWAAIQAAEEAIEDGTGRSFCLRARTVALEGRGFLEELPEVDVKSLSAGTLLGDRQAVCDCPAEVVMTYGAEGGESVRRATVKLAASYLRRRAGAENARGQSVDGVYVSYELATGAGGSWTGIPEVDAVIERKRSRRVVVS